MARNRQGKERVAGAQRPGLGPQLRAPAQGPGPGPRGSGIPETKVDKTKVGWNITENKQESIGL